MRNLIACASIVFASLPCVAADWNPRLAARYLDGRQTEWFAWKQAASSEGPCVSCHTGVPYLLARPALRQRLGDQPAAYEKGLEDWLRAPGASVPPALQGVKTIFAALLLTSSTDDLSKLWSLQLTEGEAKGSWRWYDVNLDPYETSASPVFGSALAALAIGRTSAEYRARPDVREHVNSLIAYLQKDLHGQPLHNRLAVLWAATKLPAAMPEPARRAVIDEALQKQRPDGGWALASLGPWNSHPDAPPHDGSDSYATAYSTYIMIEAGVPPGTPAISRALDWLKLHQDPSTGAWPAESMNKKYPADSMQIKFLQDAATGFACLALLAGGQ
jgi:squalene-hopene/tetraprenyl-beta-curcumene cyclase